HVDHNNNNNSQIQMGDSYQKIADNVQCGKTTVHDAIKRFKKTGSAIPKKRCGPKPLFDSNAQASLKKIIIQNSKHRRLTTHKIQELWIKKKKKKVSTVTIRQTLKKVGLHWTIAKWKKIVWSDESTFSQFSQGRSLRVWRTPEEEFDPSCLTATVKHRQTYAKVLQKHAIPLLYKLVPRNQGIFQEDNAPPHRSKIAADV
ncbi:13209_t:CDS:2, partial [Entrophospora sp. SA101]